MQLRRHGLQLLVLLMTLTANELYGAEPRAPDTVNPELRAVPPDEDEAVGRAVIVGVRSLSGLVTNENAAMLGFKNPAEVSSVRIGVPLKIYLVDLLHLRIFDPARDKVTDLPKEMKSRIYPLLTKRLEDDGGKLKTRSGLVVSQRKDKIDNLTLTWAPTNWGLKQLAQAMTEYRDTVGGFASGFLVWIPALNLHFLGDQFTEDLMLIPLADRKAYGLTKGVPISAKIVFALYAHEARSLDVDNPG